MQVLDSDRAGVMSALFIFLSHLKPLPYSLAVEDEIQTTKGFLFRFIHKGWRKPQTAYRSGEEICASGVFLA